MVGVDMRELRHAVLIGVSVIASVGLPHWAAADVDGSRFDFAFSAGGAYVSLPGVNGFSTTIDNGPFVFLRQFDGTTALEEFAPSVSLHLGTPDFDSPFFGGVHMNFDISGVWVSASDNADTVLAEAPSPSLADEFLDVLPINGDLISRSSYLPRSRINSAPARHDGLLAGRGAITLEGPATRRGASEVSILAGPRLAYQEQDYSATITDSSGHSSNRHDLDESVSAFFGGPEIGFRSVMPFGNGGDFHVIGRAAALWYGARLDAHQRLDANNLDLDLDRHDSSDDFSARIELASGVAVPIPNTRVLLTLDGNVVWWSAVPQVVNPSSGPGIDANVTRSPRRTSAATTCSPRRLRPV